MLSCELHDYVEIACLYRFEIILKLRNKKSVQGIATTTETTPDKQEWLFLENKGQIQKFNLTELVSMQAMTTNQHFDRVDF